MGHTISERLEYLRKANSNRQWINENLYRLLYKPDLYILAYERIKSKSGNMTPGTDEETLDGFSMETIQTIIEEGVPVVSFFWNDPPAAFIRRLQAAGVKVWMQAGSLQEAQEAVRCGVDAVVVQGMEAGGHNRSTGTVLSLVPAVVDAIAPVPVIAAGGIADGRGVVAALALGAEAVWVGTRLVASQEAYAHDEYKRRIVEAEASDTVRTTIFGPEWPHQAMRVIRNRVVNAWITREHEVVYAPEPSELIGQTILSGKPVPLPKFSSLPPTPDATGDFEEMALIAGESAGLVKEIKPASEIVHGMMEEARQIIEHRLMATLRTPRV